MSDNASTTAGNNFGSTHRKIIRPERFSLCRRRTGEIVGASDSPASSFSKIVAEFARERRFGASGTAAGNRKASFSTALVGSEIIMTADSDGYPLWTYRYLFFYWLRKNLGISGSFRLGQGRARFRLNKGDVRAVDQTVNRNVFSEVARINALSGLFPMKAGMAASEPELYFLLRAETEIIFAVVARDE